ncbi:MAG TPA: hypothetical protein VFV38_24325 [Ktedonobacteraceae bacterium]|nr:hypothetical protein [Ktedonobacteraceae bacterium]
MNSYDPLLSGVTFTVCPYCFFEKLPDGGWKWHCDNYHPEIITWLEERRADILRQQEEEEEAFWARHD